MFALAVAAVCWGFGALVAAFARRRSFGAPVAAVAAVAGGLAAGVAATGALLGGAAALAGRAWSVPGGALALRLDARAGVFLLPIAVIGTLGAVYGVAYQRYHRSGTSGGGSFAAYNLLLLGMALVVTADNLVLLLMAWETMTLSSWALVVEDHGEGGVRAAGLQYLVAGHVATAALVLMALLLAASNHTFALAPLAEGARVSAGALFVLALVGFGTKAGIVPLHVWLPDAHAAAPSHVSALMSGVMITMGFYGLARVLPLLGAPPLWWAYALLVLGAAGAVGGILFSLAQRDVKRALAYSTVENAGVAAMAMGVGLLGTSMHDPLLAGLGWTAALLHLWNHALAKSLLFLGFGAVAQRAHGRDLDALGGFLRRWRRTGAALVLGAAAIAALPGLNLFVSEWLLLRAFLAGVLTLTGADRVAAIGGLLALAFAGSLALAGFARLVGVGLLGAPRTQRAAEAREPGWTMGGPLIALAIGCVAVAARPGPAVHALGAAVRTIAPTADVGAAEAAVDPLTALVPLLVAFVLVVIGLRAVRSRRFVSRAAPTWGCAYPDVTASMQYSSTSFGGGLTSVMQPVLQGRGARGAAAEGRGAWGSPWPMAAAWSSSTPDRVMEGLYRPFVARVDRVATRLRALHRARVTTALLYVVGALSVLLALLFLPGFGR